MIAVETRDDVAVVRWEHGQVNALDIELVEELTACLDRLLDGDRGAVVLTGNGRAFSAGVDLFRVLDGGRSYIERFLPALETLLERLFSYPKPTVAAVDGHAIAGGCILAAAADRRLMAETAGRIGVPEVAVGVPFPPVALEILRHAVGTPRCQRLVMSGRTVGAEEALEIGLVDRVASPEELIDRACEEASRLGSVPPAAFRLSKAQLRRPAVERAARSQEALGEELLDAWSAEETLAHIRTYLERTVGRGR